MYNWTDITPVYQTVASAVTNVVLMEKLITRTAQVCIATQCTLYNGV